MMKLDLDEWREQIKKMDGWTLVDFWSPKWESSVKLKIEIQRLESIYGDEINFCELDISRAKHLSLRHRFSEVPEVVFYFNGEKKHELSGEVRPIVVHDKIKEILGIK